MENDPIFKTNSKSAIMRILTIVLMNVKDWLKDSHTQQLRDALGTFGILVEHLILDPLGQCLGCCKRVVTAAPLPSRCPVDWTLTP